MIKIDKIKIDKRNGKYITRGFINYGSPELIITLPIEKNLAEEIVNEIILKNIEIKEGYIKDLLTCPIYLKKEETNIKIIFPDPFLKFPWEEGCQKQYLNQ